MWLQCIRNFAPLCLLVSSGIYFREAFIIIAAEYMCSCLRCKNALLHLHYHSYKKKCWNLGLRELLWMDRWDWLTCLVNFQRQQLARELEMLSYSCGACFQDVEDLGEEEIFSVVFVNDKLTCESPIEAPYYVAHTDPICFYCGKCARRSSCLWKMAATPFVTHAVSEERWQSWR